MHRYSPAAILVALFVSPVLAQTPAVGQPVLAPTVSPVGQIHPNAQPLGSVASYGVPMLDRNTLSIEDTNRAANGQPARYAVSNPVNISPVSHGTWEQLDATWSLWRLRIKAPDSDHVNLGFQTFFMPAGARMQVYSSDNSYVVRPFDSVDHQPTGEFWTPVVMGSEIVCEVYVQTALKPQLLLDMIHIGSGYRYFGSGATALSDGSGSCNVDVNCPQGAGWAAEISASAAISTGGSLFCSGSMINNTANDGRNFFLTAYHCGVGSSQASSLVCYWNYDAVTCGSNSAPLNQFTIGSVLRAGWNTSDFTLVELNSTPNAAWGVTYAGWNRSTSTASSAVAIHHPSGDSKKISFETAPVQFTAYGGTSQSANANHVRVVDWDTGTTEGGSSGSPLFDQNHRIIGQLHGGGAACGNNQSDWYGRLRTSWTGGGNNSNRLSNWLDPVNTGAQTLDTLGGTPAGDVAAATSYGTGCYAGFGTLAEEFLSNTFDLSGTAISSINLRLTPTTNGYTMASATAAWVTPSSPDLGLSDDDTSVQTLPWTLNYPGGSTNQISFCSNGYAWAGNSTTADWSPTMAELVNGGARFCPLWTDLDPTSGGSCHYDSLGSSVVFTWNNVPAYTAGTTGPGNTMQIQIYQNGTVDYRFRAMPDQPQGSILAFTRGNTNTPPATDISNSLPLSVSVDSDPLTWTGLNRPLLGSTQFLQLGNIPSAAQSIGLVVIGFSEIPGGLDLGIIGAAGCSLYTQSTIIETIFPMSGVSQLWQLPIPNTPALTGTSIFTQGALLEPPAQNAFGLLTGNGVELLFGTL
ncbi:MAG: hypothetical protein ACJAYX_000098 [Planctomycetota bacterium]|jgi:hypothetical protein